MHNLEQQKGALMSPRISFSNDFVESQQFRNSTREQVQLAPQPVSSDFEFSVAGDSMMSADELFSKGKLLPFKQSKLQRAAATTLRDELLQNDEEVSGVVAAYSRPPKASSTKWKGIWGLNKRNHTVDKASELRRPRSSSDKFPKSVKSPKVSRA